MPVQAAIDYFETLNQTKHQGTALNIINQPVVTSQSPTTVFPKSLHSNLSLDSSPENKFVTF